MKLFSDLVRGSPFPKPNTQFCWDAFSKKSLLRFLLFPLFFRWWRQHLSQTVWLFFLFLYSLFIVVLVLSAADGKSFSDPGAAASSIHASAAPSKAEATASGSSPFVTAPPSSETPAETFCLTELLLPFALAMALAFIHTQIVTGARFSHDYLRHSPVPDLGSHPHHHGSAFGSPFLSANGGAGDFTNRRKRSSSSGAHGQGSGGALGATQRNVTPIRHTRSAGDAGGPAPSPVDDDEDVKALLNRCEVATLTQMEGPAVNSCRVPHIVTEPIEGDRRPTECRLAHPFQDGRHRSRKTGR